ncbi:GAF domain-containing protein [Paludibacterium paludis]|nr:GAF domain-containing protein [Paludibacterium paludis]
MTLNAVLEVEKSPPSTDIFRYPVPVLGPEGSCSLFDELAPEPYDLSWLFGGRSEEAARALRDLAAVVESANDKVGADWLGVYVRAGEGEDRKLVKLAYTGVPSRAEFPLTEAFAQISNNSRVGLTGWGVVIDDVEAWRSSGGGYYECDPRVRSEVCLPVLDSEGRVLGILDAESSETAFFTPERQAWLAGLALVLATPFAALPIPGGDDAEADEGR